MGRQHPQGWPSLRDAAPALHVTRLRPQRHACPGPTGHTQHPRNGFCSQAHHRQLRWFGCLGRQSRVLSAGDVTGTAACPAGPLPPLNLAGSLPLCTAAPEGSESHAWSKGVPGEPRIAPRTQRTKLTGDETEARKGGAGGAQLLRLRSLRVALQLKTPCLGTEQGGAGQSRLPARPGPPASLSGVCRSAAPRSAAPRQCRAGGYSPQGADYFLRVPLGRSMNSPLPLSRNRGAVGGDGCGPEVGGTGRPGAPQFPMTLHPPMGRWAGVPQALSLYRQDTSHGASPKRKC